MELEAILALDINYGLSKNNKIPWKCKKDMLFFYNKTKDNIVIMGKNTYFSLPEKNRPLKNRLNIILTKNPQYYIFGNNNINQFNNLIFTNNVNIYQEILNNKERYNELFPFLNKDFKIYIIGGNEIYSIYFPLCSNIWISYIKGNYDCDLFFNKNIINKIENICDVNNCLISNNYKKEEENNEYIKEIYYENEELKIIKYIKT